MSVLALLLVWVLAQGLSTGGLVLVLGWIRELLAMSVLALLLVWVLAQGLSTGVLVLVLALMTLVLLVLTGILLRPFQTSSSPHLLSLLQGEAVLQIKPVAVLGPQLPVLLLGDRHSLYHHLLCEII